MHRLSDDVPANMLALRGLILQGTCHQYHAPLYVVSVALVIISNLTHRVSSRRCPACIAAEQPRCCCSQLLPRTFAFRAGWARAIVH